MIRQEQYSCLSDVRLRECEERGLENREWKIELKVRDELLQSTKKDTGSHPYPSSLYRLLLVAL